jgi:hypothetical protein
MPNNYEELPIHNAFMDVAVWVDAVAKRGALHPLARRSEKEMSK